MLETMNFIMDFLLIGVALWMLVVVRRSTLGGMMGNTLLMITIGVLLLGFAHLLETGLIEFLNFDIVLTEFIHRITVMIGFVLLTLGFRPIAEMARASNA